MSDLIKRLRDRQAFVAQGPAYLMRCAQQAADALEVANARISGLEAARIAYASEFPPDAEGLPDVGNIHANIRAMKKDAERYRWLRDQATHETGDGYYDLPPVFAWDIKPGPALNEEFPNFDAAVGAAICTIANGDNHG